MKEKIGIYGLLLLTTVIFTSCQNTRYTTEWYIKNKIEQHVPGETSTLKTYSIYQNFSLNNKNSRAYIEFTGCKYEGTKVLVVGADKYFIFRQRHTGNATIFSEPTYVILDMGQCIGIVNNYTQLMDKIRAENPIPSEEVYHDFTPSKDLFISFRKSIGANGTKLIDVWVDNEKYTIKTKKFINKLKRFINY